MSRRLLLQLLILTLPIAVGAAGPAPRLSTRTIASSGDASIGRDASSGLWTVSAGGATLALSAGAGDFHVESFTSASNDSWSIGSSSDTVTTVNGAPLIFGRARDGFQYRASFAAVNGSVVQLDITYDLPNAGLRAIRHYAVTSGTPTFETWTSFTRLSGAPSVSNINAIQLSVPYGTIHYLNGLQGDNADVAHDTAFTLQQTSLAIGGHFQVGAVGRSTETTVPWMALDGGDDEFYAGLMWSGAWSMTADRAADHVTVTLGLDGMTTTIGDNSVEGPHAVFGVVPGGLPEASAALRTYVLSGIRSGRPISPLVTYNTWFAYGTDITEDSMKAEMDRVAALGVELFVVDAGWYADAGAGGTGDFDSGLGSYQADPARFPDGLQSLTAYAHQLGMKFGIWVEPEHVDRSIMGAIGVDESWLATSNGDYGSDTGQICFASAAARQWVESQLTSLLDQVQPDYLKWDNNAWTNCNRSGHGHSATDGNFAHVSALYDMLAMLRDRYPNLVIENVSGGGNRLDLGMARYSDVAWMDDRTAPSVHVRHNLEGLSAVFPPAYLLSFVTDHDGEPLHDSPDLSLYFRSRMAGALGLCFRSDTLSDTDLAGMSREISIYKTMRATLNSAAAALLTPQAALTGGPAWDVLQEATPDGSGMLICAYQSDQGVDKVTVNPAGLQSGTQYQVFSVDSGYLGTASGADLSIGGIDVLASSTAGHILIVTASGTATSADTKTTRKK